MTPTEAVQGPVARAFLSMIDRRIVLERERVAFAFRPELVKDPFGFGHTDYELTDKAKRYVDAFNERLARLEQERLHEKGRR